MRIQGTHGQPISDNVQDLLALWLEALADDDRAPRTVTRYRSAIYRFLHWYAFIEHQPLMLSDITPITLVGYRRALQQTEAVSTVNTHMCALRAWCTWLATYRHLASNPAARLRLVSRQALPAPKGLTPAQAHALLRTAARSRHPQRDIAIIQLLLQTGLRIEECAVLHFGDITFGVKAGAVLVRSGKGNKSRSVPLNASARQALADYVAPLLGCDPVLTAVATSWPRYDDRSLPTPLWRSQKGGRLSASAIARMIDGLVRDGAHRNLIPSETSAHTLRHTFAHRYLAAHPGDLVGLANLLGHTSLETTRIYVQPTATQLADRVEAIDLNAYAD